MAEVSKVTVNGVTYDIADKASGYATKDEVDKAIAENAGPDEYVGKAEVTVFDGYEYPDGDDGSSQQSQYYRGPTKITIASVKDGAETVQEIDLKSIPHALYDSAGARTDGNWYFYRKPSPSYQRDYKSYGFESQDEMDQCFTSDWGITPARDGIYIARQGYHRPVLQISNYGQVFYPRMTEKLWGTAWDSPYEVAVKGDFADYLKKTDADSTYAKAADIPAALKNPQKLIFTGAVSAEYDGSEKKTITIPVGGGNCRVTVEKKDGETLKVQVSRPLNIYAGTTEVVVPVLQISVEADTGYNPGSITIDGKSTGCAYYEIQAKDGMVISAEDAAVKDKKSFQIIGADSVTLSASVNAGTVLYADTDDLTAAKEMPKGVAVSPAEAGGTLYFWSEDLIVNGTWSSSTMGFDAGFLIEGENVSVAGSLGGLMNLDDTEYSYPGVSGRFAGMFANQTAIVDASALDFTDALAVASGKREEGMLESMFYGCSSLRYAPQSLPIDSVQTLMFAGMFEDCIALETAPEIPATESRTQGLYSMFSGCEALERGPQLYLTTLHSRCCQYMFSGCSLLSEATSSLPATDADDSCYSGMFSGCASLMFPPSVALTSTATGCCESMFSGCTTLQKGPDLLAATLATTCYQNMFNGCTSLSSLKCLATGRSGRYETRSWLYGVAELGVFTKAAGSSIWDEGSDGIPTDWVVKEE